MDLKKFYGDVILHFRNLNVIKLCGPEHPAVNMTAAQKQQLYHMVSAHPQGYIEILLQILLHEESMVKFSSHTKIAIETVLLKLLQVRPGAILDQIIHKLDDLAQQFGRGNDVPAAQTQAPTPAPAYSGTEPPAPFTGIREAAADTSSPSPSHPPPTWEGFLSLVEQQLPFISALLIKGRVKPTDDHTLALNLYNCSSFDRKRLEAKQDELKKMCRSFLGKSLNIRVKSEISPLSQAGPEPREAKARQAAYHHPLVKDAQAIFNGEIIN
jgi:DNA polymerase III subunit gamma/tau